MYLGCATIYIVSIYDTASGYKIDGRWWTGNTRPLKAIWNKQKGLVLIGLVSFVNRGGSNFEVNPYSRILKSLLASILLFIFESNSSKDYFW